MTDLTDLTDVQRRELVRIADMEGAGGLLVPYTTRAHDALADGGLVTSTVVVTGSMAARLRCTEEGLRVAERLRDEEAES